MYCFTSTATQYFANLIHKCKFVGVVLKCACAFAAIYRYLAAPRDSYNFHVNSCGSQLWISAEVKRSPGSVVLVSSAVFPATVEDTLLHKVRNNEIHNSYNDIHNFLMIFIHDIYKFIPTYRLTLSGYPTRETIHQIGVA